MPTRRAIREGQLRALPRIIEKLSPCFPGDVSFTGAAILAIGRLHAMKEYALYPHHQFRPRCAAEVFESAMRLQKRLLYHIRRANFHLELTVKLLASRSASKPLAAEKFAPTHRGLPFEPRQCKHPS